MLAESSEMWLLNEAMHTAIMDTTRHHQMDTILAADIFKGHQSQYLKFSPNSPSVYEMK